MENDTGRRHQRAGCASCGTAGDRCRKRTHVLAAQRTPAVEAVDPVTSPFGDFHVSQAGGIDYWQGLSAFVVPEPTTMCLLALGVLALRRQRRM